MRAKTRLNWQKKKIIWWQSSVCMCELCENELDAHARRKNVRKRCDSGVCVFVCTCFSVTCYFWHKNRDAGKRPTLQYQIRCVLAQMCSHEENERTRGEWQSEERIKESENDRKLVRSLSVAQMHTECEWLSYQPFADLQWYDMTNTRWWRFRFIFQICLQCDVVFVCVCEFLSIFEPFGWLALLPLIGVWLPHSTRLSSLSHFHTQLSCQFGRCKFTAAIWFKQQIWLFSAYDRDNFDASMSPESMLN